MLSLQNTYFMKAEKLHTKFHFKRIEAQNLKFSHKFVSRGLRVDGTITLGHDLT